MLEKVIKQKIGEDEFTFKMTNKSIVKIDEKYGSYAKVINGLMDGEQFYTNAVKLVSCCCVDKNKNLSQEKDEELDEDFTLDELLEKLTPQQMQFEIPDLATNLYFDYIGINKEKTGEKPSEDSEKN